MRHDPRDDIVKITFPRTEKRAKLTDPIAFVAVERKRPIVCRLSLTTLHDADRALTGTETIQELWNRYIDFVEDVAARRIELGYFERDGSVIVRDEDLEQARRAARE
jgi:hypothetical protein